MSFKRLWKIIDQHKVHTNILPALNLWCSYALLSLILYGVFDAVVVAIATLFGVIFWALLPPEAKEEIRCFWNDLPQYKFHGVFVLIEIGAILWCKAFMFGIGTINRKNRIIK